MQVFGPPSPRPDGRIKKGTGAYIGNDVYNTTGAGQTRTARLPRGATATYTVKVQNDHVVADTLRLKGTRSATYYRVTYTAGTTDITDQVTAGTYTTPALAPGATHTIRATVKVKATAPAGTSLTGSLTATSTTDTTAKDRVGFTTRRA